jgi:hypothetical protein
MRGGRGGRFGGGGHRAGSFSSFGGRDEQMGMGMEMGPTVPRSPLLEEFRNNRPDRKWEITVRFLFFSFASSLSYPSTTRS